MRASVSRPCPVRVFRAGGVRGVCLRLATMPSAGLSSGGHEGCVCLRLATMPSAGLSSGGCERCIEFFMCLF